MVKNQPRRKSYKDKEGERKSQANRVHSNETKPAWAPWWTLFWRNRQVRCSTGIRVASERGWLSLQVRVSSMNGLSWLQHAWKLTWKIILRKRRQGLTYFKLRNCKISWFDQVEIVTSAVRKGAKEAKQAFWKDQAQFLETATLSTTELQLSFFSQRFYFYLFT